MDTRFLESLIVVIDSGSIAEGARRLNLTAAAVAQRLRQLEAEIGAALVVRSGRTVRPTEVGTAILARARGLLEQVRDLKSIAANERLAGELRLGATQTAISGILPDVLAEMARKYPQIEIHIIRDTAARLYPKVMEGIVDCAIIVQPPFVFPKLCSWHTLRDEPMVVLAPRSARSRDPHTLLKSEPFIRMERENWTGQLIEGYLRKARIRPHERFELDALEAIAIMVSRGLGVSLVPDWTPPWPEGVSLLKLPVPDKSFARRIGLVWMKGTLRARLVRALLHEAVSVRGATRTKGGTTHRPNDQFGSKL